MKKAHNILEIALLLFFVVAVSFTAFSIYNNQKMQLADLSKSTIKSQSVDLKSANLNASKLNDTVPYNKTETAGTNALTYLGKSASELEAALSEVTYADLVAASENNEENIFTLANSLISQLNLKYANVSENDINVNTLSTLVGVFDAAISAVDSSNTEASVKTIADNYIDSFESLLD